MREFHPAALVSILAALMLPATAIGETIPDPLEPAISQPAEPGTATPAAPQAQQLQATRIGPDSRFAIIDGKTVRRGDWIGSEEVTRIDAASVTLRSDAQTRRVLQLVLPGVRKAHTGLNGKQQ